MALPMANHLFSALDALRTHPSSKRLRASVDRETVIDTTRAKIVWEPRRVVPYFAVPIEDVHAELTTAVEAGAVEHSVTVEGRPVLDPSTPFAAHTTDGQGYDIVAGRVLAGAAFAPADPDLDGYVLVDFDAFDEWRDEDEILVGHARDPFSRVEVRRSSRHVVVEVGGTVVAETRRPSLLFETLLPVRYYLPRDDVAMELLLPSPTHTVCAYKGHASYWTLTADGPAAADLAWCYDDPQHDADQVRGMLSFFNERADFVVDGVRQERPVTPWS